MNKEVVRAVTKSISCILSIIFAIMMLCILIIAMGCTDRNVSQVTDKVFEVDGIYLKKVVIGGDHIYFVVDSLGKPIAGTSSTRRFNKLRFYATSVVPSDSMR